MLLYSSMGDANGLANLAQVATEQGKNNIAFVCLFLLRRVKDCIDLLCDTGRIPEAAFMARTYLPSYVSHVVGLWRQDLQQINQRAAESLADPMEYENLFPDLQLAIQAEKQFYSSARPRPASHYLDVVDDLSRDLIDEIRNGGIVEEEDEPVQIVQAPVQQKPATPPAQPAPVVQPAVAPKPQPTPAPIQIPAPASPTPGSPVVSPRPATPGSPAASPRPAQPAPVIQPVPVVQPTGSPSSPRSPAASPVVTPKQAPTPSKQLNYVPEEDDEEDDLAKEIEAQIQDELNS